MDRVLAIDFGASGGKITLAGFDGKKIHLEEIHRFTNTPVRLNGTLYWDILHFAREIKTAISIGTDRGGFDSIGIDTWGVDFVLLDKYGRMVDMPVHYRDDRTDGWTSLFDRISTEELYGITGIQNMQINTIFQLDSLAKNRPEDRYFIVNELEKRYKICRGFFARQGGKRRAYRKYVRRLTTTYCGKRPQRLCCFPGSLTIYI